MVESRAGRQSINRVIDERACDEMSERVYIDDDDKLFPKLLTHLYYTLWKSSEFVSSG